MYGGKSPKNFGNVRDFLLTLNTGHVTKYFIVDFLILTFFYDIHCKNLVVPELFLRQQSQAFYQYIHSD